MEKCDFYHIIVLSLNFPGYLKMEYGSTKMEERLSRSPGGKLALWASEMVLLLWLYVKSKIRVYEYAAKVLVGLTFVSYLMDVYSVMFEHQSLDTIFLNSSFATSLFV